jgi:hypothetical protein
MKLVTVNVCPPIPTSAFDWCAYDSVTYDGAEDAGNQIVGWGSTEQAAIEDWKIQMLDANPDQVTFEFETYPSWRKEELARKYTDEMEWGSRDLAFFQRQAR